MVVELVDICAQIDPALNELVLYFALNISAREIGDCAGSYLCDKRVIIDIFSIIIVARVRASPEDLYCRVSDFERGAFLQINDLAPVLICSIDNIVVPVKEVLAVACGLRAPLHVSGIGKVHCTHMKPGIIDDIGNLVHMIIMIVGEIDIEGIEMMVIEIVDQCVVPVPDIGVHQKILAAAGEHCAVAPDSGVSEVDRCDLHISAGCLGRNDRRDGRERHHDCHKDHKERTPYRR